jgi:hypothetical protein
MPVSSLFLINPLGDLLEICCRSEMSRFSPKCCDHVEKTRFRAQNHRLSFSYFSRTAIGWRVNYPERAWFSGICLRLFSARRGQLPLGVPSTPLNPRVSARLKSPADSYRTGFTYPERAFRSSLPAAGSYHSGSLRPRLKGRVAPRKESAVKPGSVVDSHSSGMRVAAQL